MYKELQDISIDEMRPVPLQSHKDPNDTSYASVVAKNTGGQKVFEVLLYVLYIQ